MISTISGLLAGVAMIAVFISGFYQIHWSMIFLMAVATTIIVIGTKWPNILGPLHRSPIEFPIGLYAAQVVTVGIIYGLGYLTGSLY